MPILVLFGIKLSLSPFLQVLYIQYLIQLHRVKSEKTFCMFWGKLCSLLFHLPSSLTFYNYYTCYLLSNNFNKHEGYQEKNHLILCHNLIFYVNTTSSQSILSNSCNCMYSPVLCSILHKIQPELIKVLFMRFRSTVH